MIVLDASAVVEWLLQTPTGLRIRQRVLPSVHSLHVPHLLDIEAVQAIRKSVKAGKISALRGQQALEDLCDLPLNRYRHDAFLGRIWALRDNISAYDAAYIALAEALPATLITCDSRLSSAPGHRARVEIF